MKIAFLDRDGTINREYPDTEWPNIREPSLLPDVTDALLEFRRRGFQVIIMTNQPLISSGVISQKQYKDFSELFLKRLECARIDILDIFFCPHQRSEGCRCCKPRPGMVEAALEKYPNIDFSSSFLAGDRTSDIELAELFQLRSFSIGFDYPSARCTRIEGLIEIPRLL